MLLFSAVLPPAQVVESLRVHLAPAQAAAAQARWVPTGQWHITLGFYGEADDPAGRAAWLRAALAGRRAPTLRLQGAGSFSRVLYVGVRSEDLAELAALAGAGPDRPYLPHLTVARTRGEVPPELPRRLAGYVGEPWRAAEAVLMRSERTDAGSRYSVVERFPLESQQAR
jgi:2'-5' RNA ligase